MKRTTTLLIFSCLLILTLNAQTEREKYIDIVKRAIDAYLEADFDVVQQVFHKDYKHYMFGIYDMGYDDLINRIKEKSGTDERRTEFHEWVVEGNKVACTWTVYYKGSVFKGMEIYIMKDDKILEEWEHYKMVDE